MTRHLSEASTEREVGQLIYRDDQLERRVIPGGGPASYARAKREWPDDDAWELTDPGVLTPIPFTQMWTNNTAVFQKHTGLGQLPDSAIQALVPGLFRAECKVQYIGGDGRMYFQTLQQISDVDYGFGGSGIPIIGGGQHGANTGVLRGTDDDESTDWGYDTESAVWLVQPGSTAIFYISTNVFDWGGVDAVYVNAAWMWVMHLDLSSLAETDIF